MVQFTPVMYLVLSGIPAQDPVPAAPKPIRVLYVENKPRWEFRYVKNALLLGAKDIEAQVWLQNAAGRFEQEHSRRLPALAQLPRSYAEFAAYDVILVGDVRKGSLGADDAERLEWMGRLQDFVRDGGGVGFLFGREAMPEAYRGTLVEEMLPVVLHARAPKTEDRQPDASGRPIPVERAGKVHPIVRLEQDAAVNRRLWHQDLKPPWPMLHPVAGIEKGCEVVLEGAPSGKGRPIAVVRDGPAGRVFVAACDETWRMRNPFGGKYHDLFWRNVVRWLARRDTQVRNTAPRPAKKK